MELYKIVDIVRPVVNKSGAEVGGVWDINAVPVKNNHLKMKAVPSYETVANLDSGYKNKPEAGSYFLGEVVDNVLYIIKFVDMHPRFAQESESVPKYKSLGNVSESGEWSFKSPAFNFISILRNGVIKLVGGAGSFAFIDPYIPGRGVLELLDRLVLTFKNFIFNTYGGSILWTNFKENEKWKSELAVDIYRGGSTERDEDNKIKARLGSLTEDDEAILDIDINHTTKKDVVNKYHTRFGDAGLLKEIKTEKVTVTEDITNNNIVVNVDANGHKLDITVTATGIKLVSDKKLEIETNSAVNIKSNSAKISANSVTITGKDGGGELNVKGTVPPQTTGPLNSMIVCPFTGAPHAGTKVTGT